VSKTIEGMQMTLTNILFDNDLSNILDQQTFKFPITNIEFIAILSIYWPKIL